MKRSDTEDKATREALDSFLTADDEAAIVIAAATMGDAEKRGIRLHTSHASAIDLIGFAFAALSNAHGTLKAAGVKPADIAPIEQAIVLLQRGPGKA
jgi:hypothetical protein